MSENESTTLTYRILRYTPNLVRDEWVNIGVLLEDGRAERRAVKLIEDDAEFARVRRMYPGTDDALLRALPADFDARLGGPAAEAAKYIEKLGDTLSNALQFSPVKGVLAEDFDTELDRLYHDHVAPPARARGRIIESTRGWIKARLNDVFRRRRVPRLERNIRVEELRSRATRCGSTMATGTECAATCRRWRSVGTQRRQRCLLTPRSGFGRACRRLSSRRSRSLSRRGRTCGISSWRGCLRSRGLRLCR